MVLALSVLCGRTSSADWKTGPALARQLAAPLSITWASNPLRRAMSNLAASQEVAILLDRRLDPDRKLEFTADNLPLEQVLEQIAAKEQMGVSFVGPVVYFGPAATTRKLATLAVLRKEQAAAHPSAKRLAATSPLAWNELDTPREIVERIARDAGVRLIDAEKIPHDLWPAASLPPLSAAEKLTLVLAGFDLAYELSPDGSAIRPIPLPESVSMERTFPGAAARVERLRKDLPELRVRVEGTSVIASGRLEDLIAAGKVLRGETVAVPPVANPKARTVYTLAVDNKPIGGVLPALGKQLGLEVEFDPALSDQLGKLISFKVKDATLEELLAAAVGAAEMRYEMKDKKVKVLPK
jgi:hypothetical protein